ncbi:MAG: sigma-70 family RNA polymerase sigma factor [Clostridia bacterium]|nr:sigma-70 family RNA polymerase sigma factor [Clostridia bacterium]
MEKEMREEAENCTLRELLDGVRRKDVGAFERLAEQYRSLTEAAVRRFAPSFGITGQMDADAPVYALDDLRQYASMALYRAAETYSPEDKGENVSFGLYAKVCVQNAMITELRKYRRERKRRAVRNHPGEREKNRRRAEDPLCRIVSDDGMRGRLEEFRSALSGYEKEVFEHYIVGKSVTEIAERLGKDTKSVSNAIYRMKVKIRGLLKT